MRKTDGKFGWRNNLFIYFVSGFKSGRLTEECIRGCKSSPQAALRCLGCCWEWGYPRRATDRMGTNKEKDKGAVWRMGDENAVTNRSYEKELTVLVEIVGNERITMMELLRKVKEECGEVIGCRYKNPREYELTMYEEKGKKKILDGIKIRSGSILAKEINNSETVVSFLNLPTYITDEEIIKKLTDWGVTAASIVKRRMWPGTGIADGTRFLKVKFTEKVKSLPYSTKFETVGGAEHFRVLHDRQVKVCRLCIQPGHIVKDCPNFKCFKCGGQGHYARECSEGSCTVCWKRKELCVCNAAEKDDDKEEMGDSVDLYGEVEGTQSSSGEEGGEEWSELGSITEGGWSGRSSRRHINASGGMDKERTINGDDKRDDNKSQRDMGAGKAGASTRIQEGKGEEGEEEGMIIQETNVTLINLMDETGKNEAVSKQLKRKMEKGGEGSAKK